MVRCLICLVVVFCLSMTSSDSHAAQPLRLGYPPASDALALLMAAEQGGFVRAGLSVDLIAQDSVDGTLAELADGRLTLAMATVPDLLVLKPGHADLCILVAASRQTMEDPTLTVLAGNGQRLQTMPRLRDKRVGVPSLTGGATLLFRTWLAKKQVDPGSIHFIVLPYSRLLSGLKDDVVDISLVTEPWRTLVPGIGGGYAFRDFAVEAVPDGLAMVYVVLARLDAATAESLRSALGDGLAAARADPSAALRVQAKCFDLPDRFAEVLPLPALDGIIKPGDLAFWIDLAVAQGVIVERPDPAMLVYGR